MVQWREGIEQSVMPDHFAQDCERADLTSGNPAGIRRTIATSDVILACALMISFTSYLTPNMDESHVLGI